MAEEMTAEDEFRILVATDNHLGFMEKHGERGDDSFNTFEEILQLAHEKEVDFILLGGDLFHENKPSRNCMIKCSQLLKKYCFGDRAVQFEYVSDPSQNFSSLREPMVNFHDTNLNVAIPVFSIHGNHDDISGLGDTAALEQLSVTGLINYFGRWTDLKDVKLTPVLLQKGRTRLAIYGLGNIRDERLYRLFTANKVSMLQPRHETDSWFNIFVLHQNRVRHGPKNHVPVEFLHDFLDLVVWGHEHENRLSPEWQEQRQLHISQPGSSVATSLCEGEALPKAVGLLRVRGKEFRMESLPLRTVRPLLFRSLRLSDCSALQHTADRETKAEATEKYVRAYVDDLLREAESLLSGHPRQPRLPLLRVRVEYTDEDEMFQPVRFGQQYAGQIANPEDMLLLKRERSGDQKPVLVNGEVMDAVPQEQEERVEDFVAKYFAQLDHDSGLQLLNESKMALAVRHFVVKEYKEALEKAVGHQLQQAVNSLKQRPLLEVTDHSVREELDRLREERTERKRQVQADAVGRGEHASQATIVDSDEEEMREALETSGRLAGSVRAAAGDPQSSSGSGDDNMELDDPPPAPTRGRGRGRGRARGRARGGSQSKPAATGGGGRGRAGSAVAAENGKRGPISLSEWCKPAPAPAARPARTPRNTRRAGVVFDSDSD